MNKVTNKFKYKKNYKFFDDLYIKHFGNKDIHVIDLLLSNMTHGVKIDLMELNFGGVLELLNIKSPIDAHRQPFTKYIEQLYLMEKLTRSK